MICHAHFSQTGTVRDPLQRYALQDKLQLTHVQCHGVTPWQGMQKQGVQRCLSPNVYSKQKSHLLPRTAT